MRAGQAVDEPPHPGIVELTPLIRRVVAARVRDPQLVDDLVQETLTRVMTARSRLEDDILAPYALVTARNLIASDAQARDVTQRHAHRLLDLAEPEGPEEKLLRHEENGAVTKALAQLSSSERETLVAHTVDGEATSLLAEMKGSTPGAIAAQLNRARAKLRVEYLLALDRREPVTPWCRPVLFALSAGDRRRQRDVDAGRHLLECDFCGELSEQLFDRRAAAQANGEVRIPIHADADVVTARQKGREVAAEAGFSATDLTLIATAISEITRNIVRFAERGEVLVSIVGENGRQGVMVVARDAGPGVADVAEALRDGYSTYNGLGLGLPGSRRLMDEFEITSEVGKGTTVTMTKWRPERPDQTPGPGLAPLQRPPARPTRDMTEGRL